MKKATGIVGLIEVESITSLSGDTNILALCLNSQVQIQGLSVSLPGVIQGAMPEILAKKTVAEILDVSEVPMNLLLHSIQRGVRRKVLPVSRAHVVLDPVVLALNLIAFLPSERDLVGKVLFSAIRNLNTLAPELKAEVIQIDLKKLGF